MQKRPCFYERHYVPFDLPDEFPVEGGHIHVQKDKEIHYLHQHNILEIGYCHSGSGIFVIENKVFNYEAGDVSIINETEMHLAQSTLGTESTWSFIMVDQVKLLGSAVNDPSVLSSAELRGAEFKNIISRRDYPGIYSAVRTLSEELSKKNAHYRSVVRGLVWSLMAMVHRLPGRDSNPERNQTGVKSVASALQYMAVNYAEPIEVAKLANLCFLSPTHFRRIFNRAVGVSPMQYLTALRMRIAVNLLHNTDKSIHDISLDCGYNTLSCFNRHFKKFMGCSPMDLRKRRISG